jgi:hypothetical protein
LWLCRGWYLYNSIERGVEGLDVGHVSPPAVGNSASRIS